MGPSSNTFFFSPPQQAVPELAKCNNHTKSYLLTSRGLWAITHFVRKAHQAGRLHSYRHCPTKRGCLDNELQTVQDMAKACKSSRKLAEASKVSVPQSDKVYPKRIKVWDKFFFGQCSYKLGRRANQAEEPHSYKQCPTKRGCLDNELQTVQEMTKACKSSRKLAEASKVGVPQSVPKKNQGVGQFVLWTVPFSCYKLGRRANQAEEPHSYKQCPMKRKWLDMVSKQANSPNSKFWSTFLPCGVIRQQNLLLWTV